MMTSGARLLPRTLSGSTFLPQPGSVLMSMTCVVNKGHTDAWGLAVTISHIGVPGPCWPVWPEQPPQITVVIQVRAAAESPVWVHDPTAARVWIDAHGSCYQRSCRCLGSGQPPETMLVWKGHVAVRNILIRIACHRGNADLWAWAANKGHVRVHSPVTARVCVDLYVTNTTGDQEPCVLNLRAVLSQHAPMLALGELALPLTGHCSRGAGATPHRRTGMMPRLITGIGEPTWHPGHRRAGSIPCLSAEAPATQTDQISYHPARPTSRALSGPPQHLPHPRPAGVHEGTGPIKPWTGIS